MPPATSKISLNPCLIATLHIKCITLCPPLYPNATSYFKNLFFPLCDTYTVIDLFLEILPSPSAVQYLCLSSSISVLEHALLKKTLKSLQNLSFSQLIIITRLPRTAASTLSTSRYQRGKSLLTYPLSLFFLSTDASKYASAPSDVAYTSLCVGLPDRRLRCVCMSVRALYIPRGYLPYSARISLREKSR